MTTKGRYDYAMDEVSPTYVYVVNLVTDCTSFSIVIDIETLIVTTRLRTYKSGGQP